MSMRAKKKILLLNPNGNNAGYQLPLGLACLAAYLREKGYYVDAIDAPALKYSDEKVTNIIAETKPDVLGVTGFTSQIKSGVTIAAKAKELIPDLLIVFGGVHTTLSPEDVLANDCVDFVLMGEGELAFTEFLAKYFSNKEYRQVRGIGYREGNNTVLNGRAPLAQELDKFPLPARDLFPMEYYLNNYRDNIFGKPSLLLMISRGCPYNCIFCSSPDLWERKVRRHSLDYIFREIKHLLDTYGVNYFDIEDDTFTLDHKFVREFCQRVEDEKLDIKWRCLTRVNHVREDTFRLMKKAGCVLISFGIESGNQEVLNFIQKKITLEQVNTAVNMAKRVGLPYINLFMIGHLSETREAAIDSYKLAKKLGGYATCFQIMTVFPGSQASKMAADYGKFLSHDSSQYITSSVTYVSKDLSPEFLIKYHEALLYGYNDSPLMVFRRYYYAFKLIGFRSLNKKFIIEQTYALYCWLKYLFRRFSQRTHH